MALTIILLLFLALAWSIWNLYQQADRLDALTHRCEEVLIRLRPEDKVKITDDEPSAESPVADTGVRVTIEISDAMGLASRYSMAGGAAGLLAPNVLKKALQSRVLEEVGNALQESGYEADVNVIVL